MRQFKTKDDSVGLKVTRKEQRTSTNSNTTNDVTRPKPEDV